MTVALAVAVTVTVGIAVVVGGSGGRGRTAWSVLLLSASSSAAFSGADGRSVIMSALGTREGKRIPVMAQWIMQSNSMMLSPLKFT